MLRNLIKKIAVIDIISIINFIEILRVRIYIINNKKYTLNKWIKKWRQNNTIHIKKLIIKWIKK